jgi:hypothetical protein
MPSRLLELKTDLRSLKFGFDRPNDGSSGQPIIKTDIPSEDKDNTSGDILSGATDFFLRGGLLTPARVAKDVSRLTQLLLGTDFKKPISIDPKGPAFILKQNLLSQLAVRTQTPTIFGEEKRGDSSDGSERAGQGGRLLNDLPYLPTSTLLSAAGNAFGTHVPKQGINPFSQFGNEPIPGRYFEATKNQKFAIDDLPNQTNRLFELNEAHTMGELINLNRFRLNPGAAGSAKLNRQNRRVDRKNNRRSKKGKDPIATKEGSNAFILSYVGGPGAPLGVGRTRIRFSDQRTFGPNSRIFTNIRGGIEVKLLSKADLLDLENQDVSLGTIRQDFRRNLIDDLGIDELGNNAFSPSKVLSVSPSYTQQNMSVRLGTGNPGNSDNTGFGKNIINAYLPASQMKALNKITNSRAYSAGNAVDKIGDTNIKDLIKFSIGILQNDATTGPNNTLNGRSTTYIHFPAYIDGISDSYQADWSEKSYVGRGDKFYNYGGFSRTMSLSFTVVAESKPELLQMYSKLNFLVSSLAPDYTEKGFPRGNIAKLTLGDYLNETPCIINNVDFEIPQESPFEIALKQDGSVDESVAQLPLMIRVSMGITPIHDFLARRIVNPGQTDAPFISLQKGKLYPKYAGRAITEEEYENNPIEEAPEATENTNDVQPITQETNQSILEDSTDLTGGNTSIDIGQSTFDRLSTSTSTIISNNARFF